METKRGASCSPPAAFVVLACAVVRAAGCHAFCIDALLAFTHTNSFQQTSRAKAKRHASPCSCGHPALPDTLAVALLIVRNAFTSFLRLCSHAHTLPPARGLTSLLSVRPIWLADTTQGFTVADIIETGECNDFIKEIFLNIMQSYGPAE